MPSDSFESHSVRQRPEAALTPRPLRLLLVGRVKPGAEPALREVQARFPLDAAAEAGIDAVEAFIGSGQYAVQLEISRNDVQRVLATFLNDPRVRVFRDKLEPVTEGLPGPDYQFGAAEHRASGQTIYNTGDLHFAASMYRWRWDRHPRPATSRRGGPAKLRPSASHQQRWTESCHADRRAARGGACAH